MERLRLSAKIREGFRRLLEEQKLDDLSQFFRDGFFDEIPLYSRYSQLSFLEYLEVGRADAVLIRLSLDYLDRIIHHAGPKSKFLAAVTVANTGTKKDYLQPSIFVCHGRIDELLKGRLMLRAPKSVFANRLKKIVDEVAGASRYHVLQDTRTIPRKVRVFISPKHLPHPRMVGIDELVPERTPANGRPTRV